jgi:hypothetical protein
VNIRTPTNRCSQNPAHGCALRGPTAADNTQRNQRRTRTHLGWRRTVLYPVHGQSHGQFQRERLRRVSMKPRCLITFRMGVFFNRMLSRFSSNLVGTARSTRSARERATATSEPRAPRIVRSILVRALTPDKTPKFAPPATPKHRHSQLVGSSELEMQPQPFLHSHPHSPAPQFAIVHLREWPLKIVPSFALFYRPPVFFVPNNQAQYAADVRQSFGANILFRNRVRVRTSAHTPDVPQQLTELIGVAQTIRESVR